MSAVARPLASLLRLFSIAALVVAVFFLLPFGFPYLDNAETYRVVRRISAIDKESTDFVRALVPVKVGGHDLSRWILIALAFIVSRVFSRLARAFGAGQEIRYDTGGTASPDAGATVNILAGGVKSRQTLLEIMAETKKKLESMEKDLAFLSIDVVGSTEMKVGEDKTQVEVDFREYVKFVDTTVAAQGALTSAWTPDGVMICFPSAEAALTAAQNVLNGLQGFNKNVKTIKKNFRVRCGINAGRVYYDRSVSMEQMSDRVIDIAGHVQKYALPNTVGIAKPAVRRLPTREGLKATGKEVDEHEIYQWSRQ